ncbi:MAG: TIGR04283 family arsenosugar biosynthesis glycosyltransferase [Rhizobiaceae bacterium]
MMGLPISVIIPLAPDEGAWKELVPQLNLPEGSEIILAVGEKYPAQMEGPFRFVKSAAGRAQQMNAGAREATTDVLWFLHADSRLGQNAIAKLLQCLKDNADKLWFFDLKFSDDGPDAMKWNEHAVKWRSGTLKMPFGDQGFCLSRELFFRLDGYREDLGYGEDHVFAWKVRQEGYSVERVGADIFTSARKYENGGWLRTTWAHVWRTVWQGVPQCIVLLYRQIGRLFR